jgi:hypothetical protein
MKTTTTAKRRRYSLINPGKVNVPRDIEVPIFLIVHELKSRMVYETLRPIATIDCYLESHLDRLILKTLRMWDHKDETWDFYLDLMDKSSKDLSTDSTVIIRRALRIYKSLITFRDSQKSRTK